MHELRKTESYNKTRSKLAGRKLIKCPHCRELLMDLGKNEKAELFRLPTRKPIRWEEIKQCAACGGKVGYNLIISKESS